MQRRAAALYFALFLVIGAGSYGFITVVDAQQPTFDVSGESYEQGDVLTVGDRTYVVSEVTAEESEEGATTMAGVLTWENESARGTATLENGTNTTYQNESWQVVIENGSDVSTVTLRENQNVSAILTNDSSVENTTAVPPGESEPYVFYTTNESRIPLAAYLPPAQELTFAQGDTFPYTTEESGVVNATIESVNGEASPSAATLAWQFTKQNTIELEEGANVSLADGQQRVVHFPNNESVKLSEDVEGYQNTLRAQDYFQERKNGLWGVSIISSMAAMILLATAYLPVKD